MLRVRGRMGEVHVLCCCRPEVGYAYACLLTGHTATATGETSNRKDVHRIPCSLETFPADRFPRKALHIIISEDGRRKYIYIYIYICISRAQATAAASVRATVSAAATFHFLCAWRRSTCINLVYSLWAQAHKLQRPDTRR